MPRPRRLGAQNLLMAGPSKMLAGDLEEHEEKNEVSEGLFRMPKLQTVYRPSIPGPEQEGEKACLHREGSLRWSGSFARPACVCEDTQLSPDEGLLSPDKTPSSPDKTPSSPDEALSSPNKTPSSPNKTPSSPDKTLSSPAKTPSSPDKTLSSVNKTPSSPRRTRLSADGGRAFFPVATGFSGDRAGGGEDFWSQTKKTLVPDRTIW